MNKSGWTWITKKYDQRPIYLPKEQLKHEAIMKAKYIPISTAIYDTLSKEPVYSVDENPKRLIE